MGCLTMSLGEFAALVCFGSCQVSFEGHDEECFQGQEVDGISILVFVSLLLMRPLQCAVCFAVCSESCTVCCVERAEVV